MHECDYEDCGCDDDEAWIEALLEEQRPEEYKGYLIYDEWFEGEIAYLKPEHRAEKKISYFRFAGIFDEGIQNLRSHIDEQHLSRVSPNQLSLFDLRSI